MLSDVDTACTCTPALSEPQWKTAEGNDNAVIFIYIHTIISGALKKKLRLLECSFLLSLSVLFLNYSLSCSSSLRLKVKAAELCGERNF